MNATSSTNSNLSAILLSNKSGRLRGTSRLYSRILRQIDGQSFKFEVATEEALDHACRQILTQRASRVVILGGDGSLTRVLSVLHRYYGATPLPRFVLIPTGTVNLAATRLGIVGRPEAILARALSTKASNVSERPTLEVTLDGQSHVAFTFGTGLISHFFECYEAEPKQGVGAAAKIFFRTFFGSFINSAYARRILSPVQAKLVVGHQELGELGLTLLVCSVFRELGLGLKPTYRASTVPGQLHLVASTLKAHRLGPLAYRVLKGQPLQKHPRFPEVIDTLTPQFGLGLAQTTRVVLDGDSVEAMNVTVTMGPTLSVEHY
jgi:diacylglycerol kinase family enzyme